MAFGKRSGAPTGKQAEATPSPPAEAPEAEDTAKPDLTVVDTKPEEKPKKPEAPPPAPPKAKTSTDPVAEARFADAKINIFNALIDTVDLTELGKLESSQIREEITDIVTEIISLRNLVLSAAEQQRLITEICD
ncbi:MAG: CpaF family protein, partial [Proteobacteria bacterium]|nr:CpaF family protein [Pseudomonadota bacterium]